MAGTITCDPLTTKEKVDFLLIVEEGLTVEDGSLEKLQKYVKDQKIDLTQNPALAQIALINSFKHGGMKKGITEFLLDNGATANFTTRDGKTALDYTTKKGFFNAPATKLLIKHEAPVKKDIFKNILDLAVNIEVDLAKHSGFKGSGSIERDQYFLNEYLDILTLIINKTESKPYLTMLMQAEKQILSLGKFHPQWKKILPYFVKNKYN